MAEQAAREIIANKGSGVLWILDGYDELPSNLHSNSIVSTLINPNLHQKNFVKNCSDSYFVSISSGELCPLVSSRIEVLGFTAEDRDFFLQSVSTMIQKRGDSIGETLQ